VLVADGEALHPGRTALTFFARRGIDLAELTGRRRPMCRACLDWSVRRSHLAGSLGAAILDKMLAQKWARRDAGGRALIFSPRGRQAFRRTFIAEPALDDRRTGAARRPALA
jgi:hypothetical protein